jgi:hypothetical protein
MKIKIKSLLLVSLLFALSTVTQAAVRYGEATIQKGNVVIVREGRMYLFTAANNPVTLFENDTVRTLKGTALTLYNPDQHRVILGSNAIMQLKKWRRQKEQGGLRMLFGKFRARTAALRKRSGLSIRTATATIGIKGSLGEGATNSDFTSLANLGGSMETTNNNGDSVDVPVGQFAFNVDGSNQGFGLQNNPNYNPEKSEDELETSGQDNLNTEDPKEVEVPPVIQEAIDENVTEVADAGDGTDQDLGDDDGQPGFLENINQISDEAQEAASGTSPSIDAVITIED